MQQGAAAVAGFDRESGLRAKEPTANASLLDLTISIRI